jgi:hypothetical protein
MLEAKNASTDGPYQKRLTNQQPRTLIVLSLIIRPLQVLAKNANKLKIPS